MISGYLVLAAITYYRYLFFFTKSPKYHVVIYKTHNHQNLAIEGGSWLDKEEKQRLEEIDGRLKMLLPAEDFESMTSVTPSYILPDQVLLLCADQIYNAPIVLHLFIYIVLLAMHTNQKHFHLHASAVQMKWYYRAMCAKNLLKVPTQ